MLSTPKSDDIPLVERVRIAAQARKKTPMVASVGNSGLDDAGFSEILAEQAKPGSARVSWSFSLS